VLSNMSPQLQRARQADPTPRVVAAYAEATATTSNDGGGGSPSAEGTILYHHGRTRNALHVLVLVLPLTILIFGEALRHPDADIELPVVKLKLHVEAIFPIFLMILSFMLFRAMRYSRIVLWNIAHLPGQILRVGQLALDDTEAYKMNSAHYEEAFDSMAADLILPMRNLAWQWIYSMTWYAFVSLSVIVSLAIYSAICLLLGVMCFYVSEQFIAVASSLGALSWGSNWAIDPVGAIDALIMALSGALLSFAWFNGAIAVLIAVWVACKKIGEMLRSFVHFARHLAISN